MKKELVVVQPGSVPRRHFLVGGGALICLAACGPVPRRDDPNNSSTNPTPDGGDSGTPDAGQAGPSCPANAIPVGPPSQLQAGAPTFVSAGTLYVVRDAGGLYALTAVCTHQGCTISAFSSGFACPCHGARFALDGTVTRGPARSSLVHYALCLDNGTVVVDTTSIVGPAVRLDA